MIYRYGEIMYRYQKFHLAISEIWFTDIAKFADLPISEIQNKLIISVNRFPDIPISVNQNYFPTSVIRISNIGKIGK